MQLHGIALPMFSKNCENSSVPRLGKPPPLWGFTFEYKSGELVEKIYRGAMLIVFYIKKGTAKAEPLS